MTGETRFPHEHLDVYRLSLELAEKACALADTIPRGRKKLADHLIRAGTGTPLLVAEGANRVSGPDKAHKFTEGRSEAGECAAAADVALVAKIGDPDLASEVLSIARRVGSMLTGLIIKFGDPPWAKDRRA